MDSTIYLKNSLISRIKNSDNLNFLQALQTIFDSSEQELFKLTTEQEKSIAIARSEITDGKYKNHNQVIKETREWLKNL